MIYVINNFRYIRVILMLYLHLTSVLHISTWSVRKCCVYESPGDSHRQLQTTQLAKHYAIYTTIQVQF